ncbi:branched-chain amino acid ABC transporter permease [Bordetella genomosp. 13]|uniref:branched-chain amino acid ABC transporter permease n=1 Tax=Bordetella genomosp. 13 TaxID=463040 RepID=UPI001C92E74F|nr:branched-chain amino acid ABC transporter permease [Bordetella genomosp. 13]
MSEAVLSVHRGGHRAAKLSLGVLAGIALLGLPFLTNDYVQYVINMILVYGLAALGFNIVLGYLGQLAFANTAFFGIGAYAFGIVMERYGLPFWAALPVSALCGALAGLLVGLPALRLRGYYLAIVTLAFGELLRWGYIHGDTWTHGSSGLAVPALDLPGAGLGYAAQVYYLIVVVVAAMLWATANLLRSRVGRAWVAIRENEFAAASLGFSPRHYKVAAFVWSGVVTGVAGGLFAALIGRIAPESFNLHQLLLQFAIVMVGGLGSMTGSLLGALLLTAAPEVLRNFPGAEEIVFSLLLIAVLLFMPNGLAGWTVQRWPALRERLYRRKS